MLNECNQLPFCLILDISFFTEIEKYNFEDN